MSQLHCSISKCVGQVLDSLKAKGFNFKQLPSGVWTAQCPAHNDEHPSLSISEGEDGRVLLKCHAGCVTERIVQALGLQMSDLFPQETRLTKSEKKVTRYFIKDVSGRMVAIHVRFDGPKGKFFRWESPDGSVGLKGLSTKNLPLWGSERLPNWREEPFIVLVEGEKAAKALVDVGISALGTVCGASVTPDAEVLQPLAGRRVVLWADNDDAGRDHMNRIAHILRDLQCDVRWFAWHEAPPSGDAYDYLAQGGNAEKLREMLASAPQWKPAPQMTYAELLSVYKKWLALPSEMPVKFVLCTVIANRLPGDPLWAFIVGPSGDGKTEQVNPLTALDFVVPVDTLTVNTFLSGKQKKDPNASLLKRLPPGAILLMRDFTTVLEMHREKRDEVLSQLRKIYDGHLTRATGEGGDSAEISWTGKVGLIACVTPAIEGYRAFATTLGERFLYFYLPTADRVTVAKAARRNRASLNQMREELKQAVRRFFAGLLIPSTVEVPEEIGDWIVSAADFVSIARSSVERDWYSSAKEITELPDPEVPTRLSQQLDLLTCAHAVLMGRDCVDWEDLELTRQVALACIPSHRRKLLAILFEADRELTTTEVANTIDLPTNSVRRYLEDLAALRLVSRREGDTNAFLWKITEFAQQGWRTLTQPDTLGATKNANPVQKKDLALQTSGYEYSNTLKESRESLCVEGDVCSATPKERSTNEKSVAPQVSELLPEDDDVPF